MRALIVMVLLAWLVAGCGSRAERSALPATDAAARDSLPELVDADVYAVLAEVRKPGARGTLVNVWATWCQPCRQEFPDLLEVTRARADSGLRLVLVSTDFDESRPDARRFLAQHGVDFPSYFKTGDDQHFIDGLSPRWSGALPATFAFDARGQLRDFHEGRADRERFESLVRAALLPHVPTP